MELAKGNHKILEYLATYKVLFVISILQFVGAFFIANFLLDFLLQVKIIIESLISGNENALSQYNFNVNSFFTFQSSYLYFYIGFFAITLYGILKFCYNMRKSYGDLLKGQHGTSEFESTKKLKSQYKIVPSKKKEYKGESGTIVSFIKEKGKSYKLLIDVGKSHTLVIGITRSGKGEMWVFPMVDIVSRASQKDSMVINDPKGELAGASYDTLIKRGYDVHVFNLMKPHMSMGYNPLQLIIDAYKKGDISQAQQYANSITHSMYHNPNSKDPYFEDSAKSLVNAIILALTEDAIKKGQEEKINMYSVANFLSTKGSEENEEGENVLDLFFQARDKSNPARLMYATSNFSSGNTRAGIFSSAMVKLQIFTLTPNAKLTSHNSLDLKEIGFGEKPIALFMVVPDYDTSNHVLASMLTDQVYRVNAEQATMSKGGKTNRNIHFLLDEFGNMPSISQMSDKVTVGAGRGFRFHLVVQAFSQLKSKYGEESDTIIGNCSNQIYILTSDHNTAESVSKSIGTQTIKEVSRSGQPLSFKKSESESSKERRLLTADELMRLNEGESIVIRVNKRRDAKGKKIQPKPIYNRENSSAMFRYQYLADDFNTENSVDDLPILANHSSIDLEELLFLSNSEQDQYVKIVDSLTKDEFASFKDYLRRGVMNSDEIINEDLINNFTFIQLFSYLAYKSTIKLIVIDAIFDLFKEYVSSSILEEWKVLISQLRTTIEENETQDDVPYPTGITESEQTEIDYSVRE